MAVMLSKSTSPLDARLRFQASVTLNWAIFGLTFLIAISLTCWAVSQISDSLFVLLTLVGIVAIVVYYIHISFVVRGIMFQCQNPKCKKLNSSNTPWVCGECGHKNIHPRSYPVIFKCENINCSSEPKAYRCHHCDKLIFFTKDPDDKHFSYRLISRIKEPEVKPDEEAEQLKKHEKKLKELNQEHDILTQKLKIKQLDEQIVDSKPNAEAESIRKSILDRNTVSRVSTDTYEELRLMAAKEFAKDRDADKFKREIERIDQMERDAIK